MKTNTLAVLALLAFTLQNFAQGIQVNPYQQPESQLSMAELIDQVFFSTSEAATVSNISVTEITNVTYSDAAYNPQGARNFAYFQHEGSNFPLSRGVILSSGAATASAGPNYLDPLSGTHQATSWPGDSDMKAILDARFGDVQQTNNATVVEFDFVPVNAHFSFDYIFASDEYVNGSSGFTNYECSSFQDGFAFILSGPGMVNDPGINGKNIALLADGVTPVSAGTIHNNTAQCAPAQHPGMYVNHGGTAAAISPINYNGRTVKLTASHPLVPGQTYHMKIVIADRSDNSYDSAVFLSGEKRVDLEEDRLMCTGTSTLLEAKGSFTNPTFQWYLNGSPLQGATSATYLATQMGDYMVKVSESDRISKDYLKVSEIQSAINALQDLELQDDDNDEVMVFDLTLQNNRLFATPVNNVQVTYHLSQSDANAGINPIVNPNAYSNVSNPQTIYARVVQNEAVTCVITRSFNLNVLNTMSIPEEVTAANRLIVSTNTTSNKIMIQDSGAFGISDCKLFNLLGQEIIEYGMVKSENNIISLEANVANSGIYLLNFNYKDKVPVTRRVMIK